MDASFHAISENSDIFIFNALFNALLKIRVVKMQIFLYTYIV